MRSSQAEKHLSQPDGILQVETGSSTLTYRHLNPHHAGLYECHVDFFNSPVHSSRVHLVVVEPVQSLDIVEEGSSVVLDGVLGPYPAGYTLNVTCIATQGVPRATVKWWTQGMVLKSSREIVKAKVENNLVVENITRAWHLRELTCTATNSRLYRPAITTLTVHMTLLPVSVVVNVPGPLVEGQRAVLKCEAVGSNPVPRLSWTLRKIPMRESKSWVESNKTCSELTLNATRHLHLARVTCTATNLHLNASLSNFTTLIVHYPPSVRVSLGQPLRAGALKEGDNVYFTCSVAANPPATAITWFHDGDEVMQNMTAGVVTSRSSLVMRGVTRHQAGRYRCQAANALAKVLSATVILTIKYRPKCVTSLTTYFIYDKSIIVNCTVTSHPPVNSIYWQWEDRDEMTSTASFVTGGDVATSLLTVAPSNNHRRNLYCWAVNEIGDQIIPCNFTIREVGVPGWSCRVVHISTSSLTLVCLTPPHLQEAKTTTLYIAEVYFENKTLFTNITSKTPAFNISQLDVGTNYKLKVYMIYGPVTSPPVVVSAQTSDTPKKTDEGGMKTRGVGGTLVGVITAVVVASAAIWARVYRNRKLALRRGRKKLYLPPTTEDMQPMLNPRCERLCETDLQEDEDILHRHEEVVLDPLSCTAGLMRQKLEAGSVVPERKNNFTASKESPATRNREELHIGEWVQLVPQECEDTLARKLQHVAGEHVSGSWVLASSHHDPSLHLPQQEAHQLWIPPLQQIYSKESSLYPLESNGNDTSVKDYVSKGTEKCLPSVDSLAETYEDWKVKFFPDIDSDTLPRDQRPHSMHRHDYRMTTNYKQASAALHQPSRPPEDAYNNNNSINTTSNTQHNAYYDTNSNFNRNSVFFPSTTTNKRWSLPQSRSFLRQIPEEADLTQQVRQSRPRSMVRSREQMNDHELVGQEQGLQELPCNMRRLMLSEETIL